MGGLSSRTNVRPRGELGRLGEGFPEQGSGRTLEWAEPIFLIDGCLPLKWSMEHEVVPEGLCRSCQHRRVVRTAKGSRFILCEKSFADSKFPRYPALPVYSCTGFSVDDA